MNMGDRIQDLISPGDCSHDNQNQLNPKELIMKRRSLYLSIALALTIVFSVCTSASAGAFSPKAGLYYSKTYGDVTFHTYTTPIKFAASASVVIETANSLILQDVQQNKPNNMDLKALIVSLKKPLKRIYISHNHDHHWIGLEEFPGVPVYANAATIDTMKKEGADLLAKAKEKFSDKMVPYTKVVVPENMITPGEEVIDGVTFVHGSPVMALTGPVNFMEFPDQNVLIHHHLAYVDVHVPMPPAGMRAKALEDMKAKGYKYFIGGHGTPCDAETFFRETIGYFTKLDEVVKSTTNPAPAVEAMKQAYPSWGGVFLLDQMMPMHFKK
jgi:hypothetical protein